MAIEITEKPAEFCPINCPFMELHISTNSLYANEKLYRKLSTIICRHEDSCKMWANSTEKQIRDPSTCWCCKFDGDNCENPNICLKNKNDYS